MTNVKWELTKKPFVNGEDTVCVYKAETDYTAAMLISDLLEAGIDVNTVKYYSDEKDEDSFVGGNLSPKGFTDRYDQIRVKGKYGMTYEISCQYNDIIFQAAISDNEKGISYNKIAFSAPADSGFDAAAIVELLEK